MLNDLDLWKTLKPGDRVKVVSWPTEFDLPDHCLHEETREAYEWLLSRRYVLTIDHTEYYNEKGLPCSQTESVDGQAYPWADFIITTYGVDVHHSVMLNHGGLELID